ncbi:MAG: endonuclease [Bacteroidales bacterium]
MKNLFLLLFLLLFGVMQIQAEPPFRVLFYNTENLFDYRDDTLKNDNEFLPDSPRHWTFYRYRQKLIQLSKLIMAAGEGVVPALIGLCEVENDSVMTDLFRLTPLRESGYRYFITKSPDERGINVALLYKRNLFRPIISRHHRIRVPDGFRPTRDILQVSGEIAGKDTLDVFVCHFPSRSGGEKKSRPARLAANKKLKAVTDSLFSIRTKPLLLVMGDFNDYPMDKVQRETLHLRRPGKHPARDTLYNLMSRLPKEKGSHKYNGEWGYLDQFFVSGDLLNTHSDPFIGHYRVFEAPFLLTEDTKMFGLRPLRTYYGYKHEGGFSDHLPILLDIMRKHQKEYDNPNVGAKAVVE